MNEEEIKKKIKEVLSDYVIRMYDISDITVEEKNAWAHFTLGCICGLVGIEKK